MEKPYVEFHDGGYWIAETRVSLDSVVLAFRNGLSPETIALECFPSLALVQVYGAITHYLSHKTEIDAYLQQAKVEAEQLRDSLRAAGPQYYERMIEARRALETVAR